MELIVRVSIKPWSNFLAFSPDSKRVAIDNGWNIKLVELESGKLVSRHRAGTTHCRQLQLHIIRGYRTRWADHRVA